MRKLLLLLSLTFIAMVLVIAGCKDKSTSDKSTPEKEKPATQEPAKPTKPEPVAKKVDDGNAIIRLEGKTLNSVTATRPEAKKWDEPKADYQSLAAAKKAGDEATGKTVLFQGYVNSVMSPALFQECEYEGETPYLCATYSADLHDTLRGLGQYCQCKNKARILAKITNDKTVRDSYPFYSQKCIVGEILAIYDVQPDPTPADLPEGVNYASFDDILFDGSAAIGKVVDLGIHQAGDPVVVDGVNLYTLSASYCGHHHGVNPEIRVLETKETQEFFKGLPANDGQTCQRVRLQITKGPERNYSNIYHAKVIGVGDQFPQLSPSPCP